MNLYMIHIAYHKDDPYPWSKEHIRSFLPQYINTISTLMSSINILNVQVLDNPSRFSNPFQFEITFECVSQLKEDLEWKIIYVGSAEDDRFDQTLDTILVGPVPIGINKFVFQADPPNPTAIPQADIVGVTVVLLICSYKGQEFVRIGYYVNNDYETEELRENPPPEADVSKILRNILSDKPRVTRVPINWDEVSDLQAPPPVLENNTDEQQDNVYTTDLHNNYNVDVN